MEKQDLHYLAQKVRGLAFYTELHKDKGFEALFEMLTTIEPFERSELWGKLFSAMVNKGTDNLCTYVTDLVLSADNVFTRAAAAGEVPDWMNLYVSQELDTLREMAELTPDDFNDLLPYRVIAALPQWQTMPFELDFPTLKNNYLTNGYGIWRTCRAVSWDTKTKTFAPVLEPSRIRFEDLKEYSDEKRIVADNTVAFIKGLPANNVLLYGDRGTGKSSTVHAVLNEYAGEGLRLVQVNKGAIPDFPTICDMLASLPLKFIIFIDDLTFVDGADNYAELKAALEGSISRRNNVLIYATSNRRHLLKESAADRAGDDMHVADTMQEQLSLSDRFGLVVTFINPNKREFIEILSAILADRKIQVPAPQLALWAEQYALKKGGRSPRAAKQLADMIESSQKLGCDLDF